MSHFCVLVVGDDIEEQMRPFNEQPEGEDSKFLEFEDCTEEVVKEYEEGDKDEWYPDNSNGSVGWCVDKKVYDEIIDRGFCELVDYKLNDVFQAMNFKPGKRLKVCYEYPREMWDTEENSSKNAEDRHPRWSEHIYVALNDVESKEDGKGKVFTLSCSKIEPPKRVKLKDLYKSIDDFSENWFGYSKKGDRFGRYCNPNAKWDWYEIGGRFAGSLRLKPGIPKESQPNFSWGWDEKSRTKMMEKPQVDSARIKDIDWDYMNRDDGKAARFWELYIEGDEPKSEKDNEMIKHVFYKRSFYLDRYKTKENYVKCETSFSPWAILKDGKWMEKGSMGWWGMSGESNEEAVKWELGFYDEFIKGLPDDTLITMVDCHI